MCEEAFKNCTLSLIEGTPVDQARHLEECAKDVAVISMLATLHTDYHDNNKQHHYTLWKAGILSHLSGNR